MSLRPFSRFRGTRLQRRHLFFPELRRRQQSLVFRLQVPDFFSRYEQTSGGKNQAKESQKGSPRNQPTKPSSVSRRAAKNEGGGGRGKLANFTQKIMHLFRCI